MNEWYGPGRRAHYGAIIASGRDGHADAAQDLLRLAGDPLYPVIVRATALSLLAGYPGNETQQVMEIGLMDEEALIRRTAVTHIQPPDPSILAKLLGPMLYDPVKTVRIEAARRLVGDIGQQLDEDQRKLFPAVLQEFEDAMKYTADFASARHNLANLYAELDRPEDAIRQYEEAIRIDDQFYPAKANLAILYNQQGQNEMAEQLLKEALADNPELYDLAYSLGLLLVEMQQYGEALSYLEQASKGYPSGPGFTTTWVFYTSTWERMFRPWPS